MFIIRTVILWVLISISINAYLMTLPIPIFRKKDYPPKYLIQQNNRIDFQQNTECAAFSTAYLLRHFGIEADGESLGYLVNCEDDNKKYNRKVPIKEFQTLWNIKRIYMLPYSNTYITVEIM